MKKIISFGLVIGAMISLVGCGGGSSSSTLPTAPAKGVGTYNDSAVNGVSYTCGTETGVTDENGTFVYDINSSCTFSMGDIILSIINSSSLDDENATILVEDIAVAQFLQSLDVDGNASNGITITPEVITVLSENNITTLPSDIEELGEIVKLLETASQEENSTLDYNGTVVTEEDAALHLEETKKTLDEIAPVITIDGSNPLFVTQYASFSAPGSNVTDDFYDDINATVTGLGQVNTAVPGTYILTYTAVDGAGNSSSEKLTVIVQDVTIPVITLIGDNFEDTLLGGNYVELGATAEDNTDLDISANISIDASTVDTNTLGSYIVTYNVQDTAGNDATQVTRTVRVIDAVAPIITLIGDAAVNLNVGDNYIESGATVADNSGETIVAEITGVVDTATPGTYTVYYNATDSSANNAITVTRIVTVTDVTAPVVTLIGANPQTLEVNTDYVELGATASDAVDGTREVLINTTSVNMSTLGSYKVTYTATDVQGNVGNAERTVNVEDTTAPVITLAGSATVSLVEGEAFADQGATCTDNYDAECTVTVSGTVGTEIGSYTITYSATDSSSNIATEVSRTINVVENTAPVFTLPSTYYMDVRFDTHYDNGQEYSQFEAERFNFSTTELYIDELLFVEGAFITDPNQNNDTGYVLDNGTWVLEDDILALQMSVNNTVAILDGIHKLTIASIQDITDEIVNIDGTEANVTMPSGAERVAMVHEIITDEYGIDEQARTNGSTANEFYQSLAEVVQSQCGTRWFTDAKEGSGIIGISFTCGQETQQSGTLVGVKSDNTFIQNVGTWEIITLPGSSMEAIVTTINAEYQAHNDTPLFAENGDAQIWRGWHSAVGMIENMTLYNQVAFDAMSDKINELENTTPTTIPMTEAMLTGKVFYTEGDGGLDFEQISFISSSEVIFREILINQDGSILVDTGANVYPYTINASGEVSIDFLNGNIGTYALLSMTDIQWNMVKNGDANSPYSTWLFTAPANFPSSDIVDLLTLLGGKTFYNVGFDWIDRVVFDANVTTLTWEQVIGGTEFGEDSLVIDGEQLIVTSGEDGSVFNVALVLETTDFLLLNLLDENGTVFEEARFYFDQATAEAYFASLGTPTLLTLLEGQTKYFANSLGGTGFRTYATDETYTGSVTLADGTTFATSGTYQIVDNVLTINRTSPSASTLVLTYLGEQAGGLGFNITVDGGAVFQAISFATEAERDVYLATLPVNSIAITEAMLTTQSFYDEDQDDLGFSRSKMTFTATTLTRHEIWYDNATPTDERSNMSFTLPYQIIGGKIRADLSEFGGGYKWFTLVSENEIPSWELIGENDLDGNGIIDNSDNTVWYLAKPDGWPDFTIQP